MCQHYETPKACLAFLCAVVADAEDELDERAWRACQSAVAEGDRYVRRIRTHSRCDAEGDLLYPNLFFRSDIAVHVPCIHSLCGDLTASRFCWIYSRCFCSTGSCSRQLCQSNLLMFFVMRADGTSRPCVSNLFVMYLRV